MENKDIKAISVDELKEVDMPNKKVLNNDIIISGNLKYTLDLFSHPCRLDAIVVMLCVKGEARIQINLKDYTVKSGTLFINVPENIIQIRQAENFIIYPIFIASSFLRRIKASPKNILSLYMYVKNNPFFEVSEDEKNALKKFYFLIENTLQSTDYSKTEIMEGLVYALLFKLDAITCRNYPREETLTHCKSRIESIFEEFMQLLASCHTKERGVKYYASQMNITPNYLSGAIKEYSGKTASEWIDEYVILESKTLLKHSKMSIQEIAYYLNFPTQTFFGKYFKRITGISPKEYKMS